MPLFQKPACDWMLVGLGTPGAQYARTRHNMGCLALDALEKQLGVGKEKSRGSGLEVQRSVSRRAAELYRRPFRMYGPAVLEGPCRSVYPEYDTFHGDGNLPSPRCIVRIFRIF